MQKLDGKSMNIIEQNIEKLKEIFPEVFSEGKIDFSKLEEELGNFKEKSALLFGTEHSGLSDFWVGKGKNTLIPMSGTIDSLNLSNAVAITCYEILRQKLGN